jgi:hypothetical protein
MSYPEVPFKARVVDGVGKFTTGEEVTICKVEYLNGAIFFQTEFDKEPEWLNTRFEVIQEPEETEGLAYYRKLFPSGTKFKVVTEKSEAWAKVGEEYTVGDVIENCEDGIVIRAQEDLSRGVKDTWVIASRCKPIREETPNIETSDELQFKVVCNQTYILTIKGVTFELTEDEFNELERVMGDF